MNKYLLGSIKFLLVISIVYLSGRYVINNVPAISKYTGLSVYTDSMEPIISVGDYVVIQDNGVDNLQVNDIIAFYVDIDQNGTEEIVIHRLDDIEVVDGVTIYKTKAEISDIQDTWTITEDDIVGEYDFQINGLGTIFNFLSSPIGKIIIVIDIVAIFFIYDYFTQPKEDDDEEDIESSELTQQTITT